MNTRPVALVTGCGGQDGSYLSELLIEKGYVVHGIIRRSSSVRSTWRIDHLYQAPQISDRPLILHYADMTDLASLVAVIQASKPDEIYNLAAQSHVAVSFETAEYTGEVDALGALRLLEAMRITGSTARFYQASTSEIFGNAPPPQNERTPFRPCSPYGAAKLYAHAVTVNYREAYGMHASCGILFNHASARMDERFLPRKVARGVAAIAKGEQEHLYLGNLDAKRDWGHARAYVEGMYLMLQQDEPDDYVLATGEAHSVREFVEAACAVAGVEPDRVRHDPRYERPLEVAFLLGDATKARATLGWQPRVSFSELVREMVEAEMACP